MTDLEEQHIELHVEETIENELDEDHIPVWYFPSNVFYKKLGVEFIIEKHKLLYDPNMLPLFEKFAENILSPAEAFELKKEEIEIKSE
jgi:hypothetical protein